MKNFKRFISVVLLFCIMVSLLPPVQIARAAETTYRYELDTDGIDPGAEYLIVSSSNGVDYALQGGTSVGTKKVVTVVNGDTIQVVENEAEYLWTFETNPNTAGSYYVKNSGRYLAISSYSVTSVDNPSDYPSNIFAYKDETQKGCYLIYTKYFSNNYYLYLGMYSAKFTAYSNTNLTEVTTRQRLFKKVTAEEPAETFDVTYDANGKPDAILPGNETGIEAGKDHIVRTPNETQVTVDGKIYEFAGWNTKEDGSGTSYKAGDVINMSDNVTLYAQWVQQVIKYNAVVKTKLDDSYWNISGILEDTVQLYLRKGDQSWHMDGTNDGTYSAQVEGNGTYTVYMQYGDAEPVETAYTLTITDQDAAIEIAYYSVTYMSNGAVFRRDVYPAGTKITVIGEKPYSDEERFLGWMNSANSILSAGTTITASIQEKVVMTARWERIGDLQYIVRYREKGTEKELLEPMVVEGVAKDTQVLAEHVVQVKANYSYVGAGVNGVYIDKSQNPYLTISEDESKNVITIYYLPDPDLHLHKEATLEDDGTYTIQMEMFTHNNPVTTLVDQNIPLDIVLVLDQSGSMYGTAADELKTAVTTFVNQVAQHSRDHDTDHRLAIVGFASDISYGAAGEGPVAGSHYLGVTETGDRVGNGNWTNTGVFDAHGDFHVYPITGFNYTAYTGKVEINADGEPNGVYYTWSEDHNEYLLLDYHDIYRHLITEEEANEADLLGTDIYGYVNGQFVALERNSSGLWIYGDKQLYSSTQFFTQHRQVWTHRHGVEPREIHAYMIDGVYTPVDGHTSILTRQETKEQNPDKSIYKDALLPVTMGEQGSGFVDPAFTRAIEKLGARGMTYPSYGMEMANKIFAANPISEDDDRQRVVIVFSDGRPGDAVVFNEQETNAALAQAYEAKNEHEALVYTVGMYGNDSAAGEREEKDQEDFLMGLSSNYPEADNLDDIWKDVDYSPITNKDQLDVDIRYFAKDPTDQNYYLLKQTMEYLGNSKYLCHWTYQKANGEEVEISANDPSQQPYIENGKIGQYEIYRAVGVGYKDAASDQYYVGTDTASDLESYFATILRDLTVRVSSEVLLEDNSILRDIMGDGLVLTPGTVITVYQQAGVFDPAHKQVAWADEMVELDRLEITDMSSAHIHSQKGITVDGEFVYYIDVYNLNSQNPTNPNGANYHPHTVDISGYRYNEWYMNAGKLEGFRLVATITRVEAMADVPFGRATATNNAQSGLWLPGDEEDNRVLLEAFDQPSTVFVERAYVLDYGKEFQLSGWYFDDEDGKVADAIHVDCQIENGMNYFAKPVAANNQGVGNTRYGNVAVRDGNVYYTPVTTQWGGYDQFYVFGNTWRNTIVTQDANQNGNLWNKVTVIPANNIYYEDSFITTEADGTNNGVSGFVFIGDWLVEKSDPDAGSNVENPEHMEVGSYKEVHGWTDSLADDQKFTDGSATGAFPNGFNSEEGARAEFTFTGTGVEVYSYTDTNSGMVVAFLYRKNGDSLVLQEAFAMDNFAASGPYYHIPTIAFKNLDYGTYMLELIATTAPVAGGSDRCRYYIDGIRIHNPLGAGAADKVVKDAYGLETNAVFTEVRDILLDNGSFNADKPDIGGAVFIDQIKAGQAGAEQDKTKVATYDIGVFQEYGPKNEVYLSAGQAIVLKVEETNTYYVGLKSLTGDAVVANLSGTDKEAEPTTISLSHTTDMYYRVTPVDGYIVIQNGSTGEQILSITNLRTTNLTAPAQNAGVLTVARQEVLAVMDDFTDYLLNKPEEPEEQPSTEPVDVNKQMTEALFTSVRQWIDTD